MAQTVNFTIRLNVNGKEQIVQATGSAEQLQQALEAARTPADRLCRSLFSYNQGVEALRNVTGAISQITDTINGLTAESRSFSGAMAAANTMAGLGKEQFAELRSQVAGLAEQVPVARDELANGLYQVISNGVPKDNWISFLEQSAKASVGGIASLEETVKVTSTVIKNYCLAWSDAGAIQDKIQLTAKNGVTSFEQMAEALPRVAGNAATLGVSVDDLMASFATLTGVSGNTAEVSTQLAAIFTALVKPSAEATKQAAAMGIEFDAASIKAAGGLQNFLTQLDQAVGSYAARTGELRETIYGNLFGSAESLRAITPLVGELAGKFAENADNMKNSAGTISDAFGTMSSTGGSKIKMMENAIASLTDGIVSHLSPVLPMLNVASQVGMSLVAVTSLVTAFRSLNAASRLAAIGTTLVRTAQQAFAATGTVLTAVMSGQAVSMQAVRRAMTGIVMSLGLAGLAYWALSSAIEFACSKLGLFGSEAAGAAGSTEALRQQTEAARQSIQQQMADYNKAIAQLKAFKGSKEEEKKVVQDLNSTYGRQMGYFKSIGEWYKALTKNAAAYCQQLTAQARLQALAANAAQLQQEAYNILYDDSGRRRRYSTKPKITYISTAPGVGTYTEHESDLERAQRQYNSLQRRLQQLQRQMQRVAMQTPAIPVTGSKTDPYAPKGITANPAKADDSTGSTGSKNTPKPGSYLISAPATRADYENNSQYWQNKINNTNLSEPGAYDRINGYAAKKGEADRKVQEYAALSNEHGVIIPVQIDPREASDSFSKSLEQVSLNPLTETIELDTHEAEDKVGEMGRELRQNLGGAVSQNAQQWLQLGKYMDAGGQAGTAAASAMTMLGQSMQQLGADGPLAKAGATMAAIGQIALGFASAAASPAVAGTGWGWLAFVGAGLAAMATTIATIQSYATGGIVPGTSYSGDNVRANVNSGEMILNREQQARLFRIATGQYAITRPAATVAVPAADTSMLSGQGRAGSGSVVFRVTGRELVGVLANETRIAGRTGRRTKINI